MKLKNSELDQRLNDFLERMDTDHPEWDTVFIVSKINQYYFTGTMQDGFLLIRKKGAAVYYVYRSYERAAEESCFDNIVSIRSYRDAAAHSGKKCGTAYFETDVVPYGMIQRFEKYFDISAVRSADRTILLQRAVKTRYEEGCIRMAGSLHKSFFNDILPGLFREGMSEAELYADIQAKMIAHGTQTIGRFSAFQADMSIGRICFGESAVYPTNMDSPDGAYGMSPAITVIGSAGRKLKKGDLILIDLACGIEGYNTDKTQIYSFGKSPDRYTADCQSKCLEILHCLESEIKEGVIPADIYNTALEGLDKDFLKGFMGVGDSKVKFIGHGTGLCIDEFPVISGGYFEKIETGMAIALEPKYWIAGCGIAGCEETYIVNAGGLECVTGGARGIIVI